MQIKWIWENKRGGGRKGRRKMHVCMCMMWNKRHNKKGSEKKNDFHGAWMTWTRCIVGTAGLGETSGAEGRRRGSLCAAPAHMHAQDASHLWRSITLEGGLHCWMFYIGLLNPAQQQSGCLISIDSFWLFCCYMGEDDQVCLIVGCLWSSFFGRESQIGGGDIVLDANAASRLVGSSFYCPALHWAAYLLEDKLNTH